jgi:chromosome segregation ATPase
MRKRFDRSLFGYAPTHVENAIKLMTDNHLARMGQLRKELSQLVERTAAIKKCLEPQREELEVHSIQEQQLAARLLEAHLAATERLLQATREAEDADDALRQVVSRKEHRVAELQAQLSQLRLDVREMARKYSQAISRVEGKADAHQKGTDVGS